MKRKKILFFLPHLSGGGAERVTINILKQIDKNKYDVVLVVLSKNGPAYKLLPKNLEVIELNINKTLFSILKLRKVIKEIKPDIIFSSIFRGHIALYFSQLWVLNKPKIILRSPNSPKLLLERNELSFLMKNLLDLVYKSADKIIAQTPEMKKEIVYYHKVDKDNVDVFLNPIDKELIDSKISNISNPFNKDNINIVAAGRLTKQKGFDILIKSFKKVVNTNKNFKLYIIGENQGDFNILKELTINLNIADKVEFLGFQENPYKYFYFSDLYVLSSRWEGLPNTVLENLYLEKPIVATRCIPFMDQLIKESNGLLVDVEDIEELAKAILNYKFIETKKFSMKNTDINNLLKIKDD